MSVAYNGTEPYIFISYSHKDTDTVLKAVDALNDNGFRVWYDNGIEAGTEWPEYIAERMINCGVVIAFMSRNSQDSHNCRREIHFAIELKKELLVVYIEDFELSPGMRLQLSTLQAMYRSKYNNDSDFLSHLCNANILQACKESKPNEVKKEATQPSNNPKKTETKTQPVDKIKHAINEAVKKCNKELQKNSHAFYFKFPVDLTEKQISNSVSIIAKNKIKKSDIVAVMDDTLFKNAKSGYVVTKDHFYSYGWSLGNYDLSLTELRGVTALENNHLILKFADGSERNLFFNNYCPCLEVFFNTYIWESEAAFWN